MPSKKISRTQLRVADIHDSDDTLQTAASIAERTTPPDFPEPEIDDNNDLADQGDQHCTIDRDIADLHSQTSDDDHADPATKNRLLLETLLENKAQCKADHRLEWEGMVAEWKRMAAKRNRWAADHAAHNERGMLGPRQNINKMVDHIWYCSGAKEQDRFLEPLDLNFNYHNPLLPRCGPDHLKYAISLLDAWSNHQNPALRQTEMTDLSELVGDYSADSRLCLQDFIL